MVATTNVKHLQQYKIAEQILVFASQPNIIKEVKILSPNFKQIVWQCFTVFIWIVWSIFSLNSKLFHQKLFCKMTYYTKWHPLHSGHYLNLKKVSAIELPATLAYFASKSLPRVIGYGEVYLK